jgi:hypothetical protein
MRTIVDRGEYYTVEENGKMIFSCRTREGAKRLLFKKPPEGKQKIFSMPKNGLADYTGNEPLFWEKISKTKYKKTKDLP